MTIRTLASIHFRKHLVFETVHQTPSMNAIYETVAESIPQPSLLFMNYGFSSPDLEDSWIHAPDAPFRLHLNLIRHLLAGVDLCGKSVLEIGCGRGGNCYYLSRYTDAGQIVGLDLCALNLVSTRQNPALEHAEFIAGDAQQLPFASGFFDIVLNLESAHCYSDFGKFVAETARVLKSRGIFCFADLWDVDALDLDWQARRQALNHSQMEIIEEEDISEQVFLAIAQPGNICEQLDALADAKNRSLIARIIRSTEALQAGLATGDYSYRLWKMRKV